ncbi:MAG: S9 family peptidase [Deltaproteobacteria bacterium]|nr:S9 family peptidase [Deltaproteobacteria bacterium]
MMFMFWTGAACALLAGAGGPGTAGAVTEDVGGVAVKDPYRALEDDATARPYLETERRRAAQWLVEHRVPGLRERLEKLAAVGSVGRPRLGGERVFFTRQDGKAEQPLFVVREGTRERVLLDLGKQDPTGKTALDWFHPSWTGRYVVYGISRNGDENSVLRVLETGSGRLQKEEIPDTRWCDLTWLRDDSGFFYRRFPPGERYSPRIHFHRLGTDWKNDPVVFGDGLDKTFWPSTTLSDDGKALLIAVSRGWSATDLYWMDLPARTVRPLVVGGPGTFDAADIREGRVYAVTDLDAPRGRLVRIDPANPGKAAWETLVPEGPQALKGMLLVKGGLVTLALDRAVSRMQYRDNQGALRAEIPLPGVGSVNNADARMDRSTLVVEWASLVTPPSLLTVELSRPAPEVKTLVEEKSTLDLADRVVEQVSYRSSDGTEVPMFLVHRRDWHKDGSNPVLLTGYGGFNVSLTPSFSRRYLYWVERGGVLAVANLRGGGELGEAWHEAGRRQNKPQVFADFEYAMRFLVAEGITRPERLVISGGSNGGLLVGAAVTRTPHLFRAAYAAVGLFDMVRFHRWPPAELWVDEYGSADNPADAPYLWAYSPYHQVADGVRYPAVLVATAAEDTRVTWRHSAKFAARLQAAQAGSDPVLLFIEDKAGHGQGKGRTDQVEEQERMFTFLLAHVPIRDP